MAFRLSRRALLRGAAGFAGGAALSGLALPGLPRAQTATRPSAVLLIHLLGGYNQIFSDAAPFITYNHFGVTASNVTNLGNGLMVDSLMGTLPTEATTKMAAIGVYHKYSGHDSA